MSYSTIELWSHFLALARHGNDGANREFVTGRMRNSLWKIDDNRWNEMHVLRFCDPAR
jgi:hypothetical protein